LILLPDDLIEARFLSVARANAMVMVTAIRRCGTTIGVGSIRALVFNGDRFFGTYWGNISFVAATKMDAVLK
jgi:hypothetical protein